MVYLLVSRGLMRLVFLGPPGAGKGTMVALMGERLKVGHLSSGDLLRQAVHRGDSFGQQVARFMQAGILVPDQVITGLVLKHLNEVGKAESFVLDGFPRTVEQARALDAALATRGHAPIDLAVDFPMSPEKVVSRLAGRRICAGCGANYHLVTLPPRCSGICDRCGAQLQVRPDDQKETILKRLVVYRDQTEPLLVFYKDRGKLKTVSGELAIEQQYQALIQLLEHERLLVQ